MLNRLTRNSFSRTLRIAGMGTAAMVLMGHAMASPVTAGDFPAGSFIESFDAFAGAEQPPVYGAPFTLGNITFSDIGGNPDDRAWIVHFPLTDRILSNSLAQTHLVLTYGSLVEFAGLNVGFFGVATYEVTFFDDLGVTLGSVVGTNPAGGGSIFVGWQDANGIKRVEIVETSPDNGFATGIDDIRTVPLASTSVPEPNSLLLAGAALGLLGLRSRKG